MEMYDFFYNELKGLKAITGFTQWEKLNELADPEKAINDVIIPMVEMTRKEPFKIVKPNVLQRVIHDAILNDGDFTGLNAKFVLKALNAWWAVYGDKILQARDQKGPEVYQKVELSKEDNEKVNVLLESYKRRLMSSEGFAMPRMTPEEIKQTGREWVSEIDRKAVSKGHRKTSESELMDRELHIQYIRENYDPITAKPKPGWMDETEWRQKNKME